MWRVLSILGLALGVALLAAAGAWLAASRADGPWGPLPGGPFREPGQACSDVDWPRFAAAREVELEVWPERPRSITTWSVVHQGQLYLPADFLVPWKRWPHQVRRDDRVRLRLGGEVFACRLQEVDDPALVQAVRESIAAKYSIAPDGRAARVEIWWFRVVPR